MVSVTLKKIFFLALNKTKTSVIILFGFPLWLLVPLIQRNCSFPFKAVEFIKVR